LRDERLLRDEALRGRHVSIGDLLYMAMSNWIQAEIKDAKNQAQKFTGLNARQKKHLKYIEARLRDLESEEVPYALEQLQDICGLIKNDQIDLPESWRMLLEKMSRLESISVELIHWRSELDSLSEQQDRGIRLIGS
jgi:hypothetical protein